MAGLPPLQPPLPVAPAVAPAARPPPAYGAAVGVPAPTATAVGTPVAAALPSRTVTADLTISPFADVMRWAPDMRNPRSVGPEDVVRFFLMLQDTYGGVARSAMLPEGLQVMWAAAFYLKRFGKVAYTPEMSSESANGVCGFVRPNGPAASPAQFVKFQTKTTADDVRMDVVNAVVMAKILEHESVKSGDPPTMMHGSILKFSDAFLGVLETFGPPPPRGMQPTYYYNIAQQVAEGRLLQVPDFFQSDVPRELQAALKAAEQRSAAAAGAVPGSDRFRAGADLTFADERYNLSYLQLLRAENPGALLAPAVAFDAIDGVSLRELMQDLSATASFKPIAERLDYLFRVVRVIGQYGWVHNDLHMSNILHDRVADRLVLIDYGRTFLDTATLPADIRDFADREMLKLDMLLNATHLKSVASAAGGSGIQAAQANRYANFVDEAYYATRLPVISPQVVARFRGAPANFGKCLFMYDLATVTLGIMKRATVQHAPAQKVAEEFRQTFSDTGIAEFEGNRMLILDFDSYTSVLESPARVAGVPAHMNLIMLGLLWTSMVLTAVRDDALHRGEKNPAVFTMTATDANQNVLLADFMSLSQIGVMFIGGLQFLRPCVDARVMKMFLRMEGYIQTYFDTGFLVAPVAPAVVAVPGGAGGMFSVARSTAMRSRLFAPSSALRSRFAAPSARAAKKLAGDALDPSVIADKRRATPTAWARKALGEYVSPLAALPPVFRLDADGGVAAAKLAGGGAAAKRAAAKRASAGAKRAAGGAAPSAPGELMRRVRAMLQALPDPNAKKTARLVAELENTRPFVLERAGDSPAPRSAQRSSPRSAQRS